MTVEEMHAYNRHHAITDLSYESVCKTEFTIQLRKFMEKWLEMAYERGYQAAKKGEL